MDGYGRRDVNGKANAGLTLGIIGTALGAWALFGNRRSAGVLGTGAGLMGDGSININVVGAGMGSAGAPTAFQAWSKSCEDTLALQGGLYQWALTQQNQDDMIFESAIDFWFDDVDFGEDKLWKYFNELK